MNNQVREVLSRFYEDPQDSLDPNLDNLPFLDYLKKKAPLDVVTPRSENPGVTYNPYVTPDVDSVPKDIGDSGVFVNYQPTHPTYTHGEVFEEDSPMQQWYKSRRIDWTDDPKEQQPLISLTRRHASQVKEVIASYLMNLIPLSLTDEEYNSLGVRVKTAASLNDVINQDYHYKNDAKINRAAQVRVSWTNESNPKETKAGKFIWKANSPDSGSTHTVIFQFHQAPEGRADTVKYVDLPVNISCSCESFLWYGAQWYALQGGYMYLPALRRSVMPPRSHNQISRVRVGKGLNFRVCKHILAVYDEIENWDLKTEYKSLVKVSPLSKIMNPGEFERLLGLEFSYPAIKEALQKISPMTTKMKSFFKYKVEGTKQQKMALSKLDRWYFTKFRRMSEPQKLTALEAYVNHPEEIFYLILRDAIVNRGKVSDKYIKEAVILMSKVIDPAYGFELKSGKEDAGVKKNEAIQEGLEGVPEEEKKVGEGTGFVSPSEVKYK